MKKIVFIFFLSLFACSSHKNEAGKDAHLNPDYMKSVSYDSYDSLWKTVQTYEKKALTKSAFNFVEKNIYPKAKKEQNAPQIVKSLLYIAKYSQRVREESLPKTLELFKKEIKDSKPPLRNILQNYLAQFYWRYYQQNRHKFASNLASGSFDANSDFRTWDMMNLFAEINRLFDASLQEKELLKQIPITSYKEIIDYASGTEKYYPSLYDLLLNEALKFYTSEENSLPQPAYKFSIDNPVYLSDTQEFINAKISSKDSLSLLLKALRLYQDWEKTHFRQKEELDALATADLQRISFVYNHGHFQNKDSLYLATLEKFTKEYKDSDVAAKAYYYLANYYFQKGMEYNPEEGEKHRFDLVKALEYCDKALENYPKSEGASLCGNLKNSIKSKELNLKLETVFPENEKQLVKIRFKNIKHYKLSVYRVDYEKYWDFVSKHWQKEQIRPFIHKQKLVYSIHEQLPDTKDYQHHSIEKGLKELPNGQYVLLVEDSEGSPNFGYSFMQSTDIALQKLFKDKKYFFTVVDRNNGQKINDYQLKINKRVAENKYVPVENWHKEKEGSFFIKAPGRYEYLQIKVIYDGGKTAWFNDNINAYYNHPNEEFQNQRAFLFTDRSIYRPGQIVYFKVLALQQKDNHSDLLTRKNLEITLRDANYKEVSKLKVKTNEYGSAAGNFVLPKGVLTGNFHMEVKGVNISGRKDFKVENYKRPKFEVKFSPVKEAYKVNELVKVNGEAVSYSGAKLTDATVTYRVKRVVELPRWWYWYRPVYRGAAQEIAHGTIKTNQKGEFEISFRAIPDLSLAPEDQPVFIYEVMAEVTDINGETHTATSRVKAGYQSLKAKIELPSTIIKENKKDSIQIEVTNLNGVAVPAKADLKIFKLKAPDRILRPRPWPAPDMKLMDKESFVSLFPHIPYDKQESDFHFWPTGKTYYSRQIQTPDQEKLAFPSVKNWPEGKYMALITTTDKDGNEIKDKSFFDIVSFKSKLVPDRLFFDIDKNKKEYRPGENLSLKISSAVPHSYTRLILEKDHKIIYDKWIKLDNTSKTIKVPILEKDRGGFVLHYMFYAYNTYKKGQVYVPVPYPSKELKIETVHFRDKLIPGEKETWSFQIKGPKGEKVVAEVLASMYDASLDAFVPHKWQFSPIRWRMYSPFYSVSTGSSFGKGNIFIPFRLDEYYDHYTRINAPRLKLFGFSLGRPHIRYMTARADSGIMQPIQKKGGVHTMDKAVAEESAEAPNAVEEADAYENKSSLPEKTTEPKPLLRKNLKETAFFYPQISTDKNGKLSFSFVAPDALTKWKLQLLAHDKKLDYAYKEFTVQTQKDLMIFPNMPRFVREGDQVKASVKITNLSDKKLNGFIEIFLNDALTEKDLTSDWVKAKKKIPFELSPKSNTEVSWTIQVKDNAEAVQYKFMATAGNQSDGEQNIMPVLSNRILVTETMPMWVRPLQEKTFVMDKLKNQHSGTLKNHGLSLEITSNPAWYAIQALPYLMESQHENSEEIFSRFYANSLAEHIVKKHPQIQRVFEHWKNSEALLSALEKNPELKSIVLEATPWVRDAESEEEQKKRIALLFDYNKMSYELSHSLDKLGQMQLPSGGFVWYKGAPYADRYITQYIVNGLGHLKHLGVDISSSQRLLRKAVAYTDQSILKDYEHLLKQAKISGHKQKFLNDYQPGLQTLYYLYGRSFYDEIPRSPQLKPVYNYYLKQAQKFWTKYDYYPQALLALTSYRNKDISLAKDIIKALDENSVDSPELGKYWKGRNYGWRTYQSGIERQALLIEAFQEIGADQKTVDEMRIWLLKNKQTNAWKNTKQTAEAIYAFLNSGTSWLPISNNVKVRIGGHWIDPSKMPETKVEAGTGYFKKAWSGNEIKPEMAQVKLVNKGKGIVWGALYWQYFENLDKITQAKTNMSVSKDLFVRKLTDRGEELRAVTKNNPIHIGDLVRVRLIIKVDRDMEYVHLKDLRASGLEPIDVLSGYKWKNGLGYYLSVTDVSTNFFFSHLPKGVYVFEYDLRANNAGVFSGGIARLQSMYAPEFSSHSKGQEVIIAK